MRISIPSGRLAMWIDAPANEPPLRSIRASRAAGPCATSKRATWGPSIARAPCGAGGADTSRSRGSNGSGRAASADASPDDEPSRDALDFRRKSA